MKKYVLWGILLAVLGAGVGYVYSVYLYKVNYVSSAQLIVLTPKNVSQAKDYASIATSRSVLEAVREAIGTSDRISTLQDYVVATNISGTNMISIEVTTDDAAKSQAIAQSVSREIGNQAKVLFGENNTSIVDEASRGRQVGERNPIKASVVGAVAGIMLTLAAAFVFYDGKKEERGVSEDAGSDGGVGSDLDVDDDVINSITPRTIAPRASRRPVEIKKPGRLYGQQTTKKEHHS